MSRRDTIIIAALINAGLLIILFVSALKNKNSADAISTSDPVTAPPSQFAAHFETKAVMGDEVDQVLSQYSQPQPAQQVNTAPTAFADPVAAVEPIAAASPNFVDDLKAISQPEAPSVQPVAATEASQAEPVGPSFVEVKVKKGDVLEKIARHNHTTVQDIMKLNKLSSTSLKIGQVLKVPSKPVAAAKPKVVQTQGSADSSAKYYTVKAGDNPWTIAVKNHIKVEDLLRLNNMNEDKARKLKPGDQIRIR